MKFFDYSSLASIFLLHLKVNFYRNTNLLLTDFKLTYSGLIASNNFLTFRRQPESKPKYQLFPINKKKDFDSNNFTTKGAIMKTYTGSCLCGDITYKAKSEPIFPHLCSCHMCQKASGAPTVAWVDFSLNNFIWDGPGGEPEFFRSSQHTQRCFCGKCGGTLGALDDGSDTICITISSLEDPSAIAPDVQHSFEEESPVWWKVSVLDTPIQKKILKKLQENDNTLNELDLTGKGITDDDIRILMYALKDNQHLQSLNLSHNLITDKGALALAECNIKILDLRFNQISEEGRKKLDVNSNSNYRLSENRYNLRSSIKKEYPEQPDSFKPSAK